MIPENIAPLLLGSGSWNGFSEPVYGQSITLTWTFAGATGQTPTYYISQPPEATQSPTFIPTNVSSLNLIQQNVVVEAMAQWASVANITFAYRSEIDQSQLVIGLSDSLTGGLAFLPTAPHSTNPWVGDIWLSNDVSLSNPSPGSEAYSIIVHEIGHALGLRHPYNDGQMSPPYLPADLNNELYSVMVGPGQNNPYDSNWHAVGPMLYDIAAIQYLYGANLTFNAGSTTHSISGSTIEYKAIWDGEGVDTLSAVDTNTNNWIDLVPGGESSINTGDVGHRNVSVAFLYEDAGWIENAIGGSQRDVISGNLKDNRLEGRNGDDILVGYEGNDTLVGGAGNDALVGGSGQNHLDGGAGFDTYYLEEGENFLTDSDDDGVVVDASGRPIVGMFIEQEGEYVWMADSSVTATFDSIFTITLSNDSTVTIEDFNSEDLNIRLWEQPADPITTNTITGDKAPQVFTATVGVSNGVPESPHERAFMVEVVDELYDVIDEEPVLVGFEVEYRMYDENDNVVTSEAATGRNDFSLSDSSGNDLIESYGGADYVVLKRGGSDWVKAGAGQDAVMVFEGADHIIEGGAGSDTIYVLPKYDVSGASPFTGSLQIFADEQTSIEQALLDNGESSSPSNGDLIMSGGGDDLLVGSDEGDVLIGAEGEDLIIGGSGQDFILADANAFLLMFVEAGEGEEVSFQSNGPWWRSAAVISESDGGDILTPSYAFYGDNIFSYQVSGANFPDIEYGESVNWTFRLKESSLGYSDEIHAGADDDFVRAEGGDDIVYGDSGNDDLSGGAGSDFISGGVGDDVLHGDSLIVAISNSGNDYLDGGAGNDQLFGDDGDDVLVGGTGNDELDGGGGSDSYYFGMGEGNDTITDSGEIGMDTLFLKEGIESEMFSLGVGYLVVGEERIMLGGFDPMDPYATGGIEEFLFADGEVLAYGDLVDQGFSVSGGTAADTLTGTNAIDFLFGDEGDDELVAYAGSDFLDGGLGADSLVGGVGDDIYVADDAGDSITESAGNGTDTVLSSITYSIASLVNLENITLTGVSNIDATGNGAANVLIGNGGGNTLTGNDGNDTLDGGGGADTLYGGAGNDFYVVDDVADLVSEAASAGTDTVKSSITYTLSTNFENLTLTGNANLNGTGNTVANAINGNMGNNSLSGSSGNDTLFGDAGADTLDGGDGSDSLTGGSGNDSLFGGAGIDSMAGGVGDDIFVVDSASELVIESASEGTDLVQSSVTLTLAANVENLTLTGTGNTSGTGNAENNTITGNSGNNTLNGLAGNDILIGGAGNDTYVVDAAGDVVQEGVGAGTDLVQSSVTYTLVSDVENLTLTGTSNINGTGNSLNNTLTGNSGENVLTGGLGNDIYVIDALDTVVEYANEGTDRINAGFTYSLVGTQIENLVLTGTGNIDGTGNDFGNVLTGNSGANVLTGGLGNDTYVIDALDTVVENANEGTDTVQVGFTYSIAGTNLERITLLGTGNIDATGNDFNNILTGNSGANVLTGGLGNDTYVIDALDTVVENANEGTDTVQVGFTYSIAGTNLERITLLGTANIDGTGNDFGNVLTGNSGANVLTGGLGNDTYVIDALDTIVENANEGTDTVQTGITYSLVGTNLENLTLTGTANIDGTGNDFANTLIGNGGANVLTGGLGNDLYVVDLLDTVVENSNEGTDTIQIGVTYSLTMPNVENLTLTGTGNVDGVGNALNNALTGSGGNNILTGGAGNDTLNGGLGTDTLIGGADNDTYVVDTTTDTLVENGEQGTDVVQSSVNYALGDGVENLILTSIALVGTGNSLANLITGTSAGNTLDGADGNDTLDGGAAFDTLIGGAGNDSLVGGSGSDSMVGGTGDDIYDVNATSDVMVEMLDEGVDLVLSLVTLTLSTNVENLTLTGTSNINGTGNSLNNLIVGNGGLNVLTGNGGNDTLDGGVGSDTLVGGVGNDIYVVSDAGDVVTESASEGIDTVQSSVTYILGADVEHLSLAGASNLDGTGNSLDNFLTGNAGNNALSGQDGADTLNGGEGVDTIDGGEGDDVILVESVSGNNKPIDLIFGGNGNQDILRFESNAEGASIYITPDRVSGIEIIQLTDLSGSAAGTNAMKVYGRDSGVALKVIGNDGNNYVEGNLWGGNDTLLGGGGNDTLIGIGGDDLIDGGAGDDVLSPTFGVDTVLGGTGNDLINAEGYQSGDIIDGGEGEDTFVFANLPTSLDLTSIPDTNICDIESIFISFNSITLNLSEVLAISSTTDTLLVESTWGTVNVTDGDWVQGEDQTISGTYFGHATYHTYTNQSAILLIDDSATVNFI